MKTITVAGASEHNLKAIDVAIPRGAITVVTGVSGSGKSSLAFDTIHTEGRRRYLETFSSYARQFLGRFTPPEVAHIDGLSPAIAIDQGTVVRNPRSTVGTLTELADLLRLIWARLGSRVTPGPPLSRQLFSFNTALGACPACSGLGVEDRLDPDLLVVHPERTLRGGALRITTPTGYLIYSQVTIDVLDQVCRAHGFNVDLPWRDLTEDQRNVVLNGSDRIRIPYGKHPLSSRLRWTGITAKPREEGVYKGILPVMEQILRQKRNKNILRFVRSLPCRACGGTRLRPEALAVTFRGMSIAEASRLSIRDLARAFEAMTFDDAHAAGRVVRREVLERCAVLDRLGLGHLALDRESTTLSSGEAQRLRLARQATSQLQGVLYVLDEPTVGLHASDTERLLGVLRMLRDRGNTVLVVEHDEQVMRQAEWLVDIGPAAGTAGGWLLFSGTLAELASPRAEQRWPRLPGSRTYALLTGRGGAFAQGRPEPRDLDAPRAFDGTGEPASPRPGTGTLRLDSISRHNLRDVSVELNLGAFNAVTGVSGAGKSTLVGEVVRRVEADSGPSRPFRKVIAIDRTPIGRTPRSNPATYTGLFDEVRDLFARLPEAVARGFGKGRFSFNVKGGRCETCEGAGVQQVGMQFLGTASLVCEACAGRRFNDETLEVTYQGRNIHDVLEMPIDEACAFLADQPRIARRLETLRALGLGYLPLGHPATMLSGGEAQRVKLAAELARPAAGATLYVLDEPTAGLHAADVAILLEALRDLVARGHTLVVVEHQLDVIEAADWVIDLGPGSGDEGGRIVVAGDPDAVAASPDSRTGAALRKHRRRQPLEAMPESDAEPRGPEQVARAESGGIRLEGVSTHNLRHIDVHVPGQSLTVVTGVSGSGKSSLAFDTIFAEGQRRFAESFSSYGRRLVQPLGEAEFAAIHGLTPAVAIAQHAPSRNPRSTVGTLTEIHDRYRLLFARAGVRHCPGCGERLTAGGRCPRCAFAGVPLLTASMFSPNSERGTCRTCRGLGDLLECDPERLVTDPSKPLAGGAMSGHLTGRFYGDPGGQHMAILAAAGEALGFDYTQPWVALPAEARRVAMHGAGGRRFDVSWAYRRGARQGVHRFQAVWPGLVSYVGQEFERKHADRRGEALEPLMHAVPCPACHGGKLQPEFLAVRVAGRAIHEMLGLTVAQSLELFAAIDAAASGAGARAPIDTRNDARVGREAQGSPGLAPSEGGQGSESTPDGHVRALQLVRELRRDIVERLSGLRDAGLDYLTLDRTARSLSGGEAQRVRLAAQLKSGLTGITYVLDEPTTGLHARDTGRLLALLRSLRDTGNTVVVVEHDLEVIAAADHVIELGPGGGRDGGRVIVSGPPGAISAHAASVTGRYLRGAVRDGLRPRRNLTSGVSIRGASAHNLRMLDVEIPAGGLVVVTGVSGSGKSTLVFDVLAPSVERWVAARAGAAPVNCRAFEVHAPFHALVRGRGALARPGPSATVATETGIFEAVRSAFAAAAAQGGLPLRAADFSTAKPGGRCEVCEGVGEQKISMDFLPDVWVRCEECGGARYRAHVLECRIAGRHIAAVLDMTVSEARTFFGERPPVLQRLEVLEEVGLGYLPLGQPVRTLSGGERQRLRLAGDLLRGDAGPTLYLFDEPTAGLHAADVERLMRVFERLVDGGHTLIVIEHHLGLIAVADWVLDLGPESGDQGGLLVAQGTPEAVAADSRSHTGRALKPVLARRTPRPS